MCGSKGCKHYKRGGMKYRPVVRIDVRKDGESNEFKQANSEEIPTFSLIDLHTSKKAKQERRGNKGEEEE